MKKKLYFVKREVMATSVRDAMRHQGKIYEIVEAAENLQPIEDKPMGLKAK